MPVIRRRGDGVQFITQAYRELLELQNRSMLKREVKLLSENHGDNVCLIKQNDNRMEAVFSNDSGFLLGETVWAYFGKPHNLIYCEEMPGKSEYLLVIARNGNVYLETQASNNEIINDLTVLAATAGKNSYHVYIYGNTPLSQTPEKNKFTLVENHIKSFTHLTSSAFKNLPQEQEFQLQPLESALASQHLTQPVMLPLLSITIVLFIVAYFAWPHPEVAKEQHSLTNSNSMTVTVRPYLDYEHALETPKPSSEIKEATSILALVANLPGWNFQKIYWDGQTYSAKLTPIEGQFTGSLTQLKNWANTYHLDLNVSPNKAILKSSPKFTERPKPHTIYKLKPTLNLLLDRLTQIIANTDINVGNIEKHQQTKSVVLTINFGALSPAILTLLAEELDNFPTEIMAITLNNPKKIPLLSGIIQFNLWGN